MSVLWLGSGFTGMVAIVKVFSFPPPFYTLSEEGNSFMHVGQPRLMPRLKKGALNVLCPLLMRRSCKAFSISYTLLAKPTAPN